MLRPERLGTLFSGFGFVDLVPPPVPSVELEEPPFPRADLPKELQADLGLLLLIVRLEVPELEVPLVVQVELVAWVFVRSRSSPLEATTKEKTKTTP